MGRRPRFSGSGKALAETFDFETPSCFKYDEGPLKNATLKPGLIASQKARLARVIAIVQNLPVKKSTVKEAMQV